MPKSFSYYCRRGAKHPQTSSVRLCFGSDSQEQESITDISAEPERYKNKVTAATFRCVLVPEWLTGMTRNHVGFARAGSNPAKHAFPVFLCRRVLFLSLIRSLLLCFEIGKSWKIGSWWPTQYV